MNPWLLGSGIGMFLVGIFALIWWKKKTGTKGKYFGYGMFLWLLVAVMKGIIDLAFSPFFSKTGFQEVIFLMLLGLYVGLRTGFLESGLGYLWLKRKMVKGFKEGVAFGIGFASLEAVILGMISFVNVLIFLLYPSMIQILPEYQREMILKELEMETLVIFAPIMERISTIFIHIFSFLLVVFAVKSGKKFYLWLSIGFKSLVDGMIPWMLYTFDKTTLSGIYSMEAVIMVFGLTGFLGIQWMKKKWK